MNTDVLI